MLGRAEKIKTKMESLGFEQHSMNWWTFRHPDLQDKYIQWIDLSAIDPDKIMLHLAKVFMAAGYDRCKRDTAATIENLLDTKRYQMPKDLRI